MLIAWVKYPPSANRLWRSVKGRNIKSEEYRDWMAGNRPLTYMVRGPYRLLIEAQRPDKRRRDLGNIEKPLSDALVQMGGVEDDCLAEEITLRWVKEDLGGMVRMTVTQA